MRIASMGRGRSDSAALCESCNGFDEGLAKFAL